MFDNTSITKPTLTPTRRCKSKSVKKNAIISPTFTHWITDGFTYDIELKVL
jgi:hypothetical protein